MPRDVYILVLLVVACCRVLEISGPMIYDSSKQLIEWQAEESGSEDVEIEKSKQESKEEYWRAQIDLGDNFYSVRVFNIFSDNKLLEHTRKPVSPPPNLS